MSPWKATTHSNPRSTCRLHREIVARYFFGKKSGKRRRSHPRRAQRRPPSRGQWVLGFIPAGACGVRSRRRKLEGRVGIAEQAGGGRRPDRRGLGAGTIGRRPDAQPRRRSCKPWPRWTRLSSPANRDHRNGFRLEEPKVCKLSAGGSRIRTLGPREIGRIVFAANRGSATRYKFWPLTFQNR